MSSVALFAACANAPYEDRSPALPLAAQSVGASVVPPLTAMGWGDSVPPGWEPWIVAPWKTRTDYSVDRLDGIRAIRARANSSASGLFAKLDIDPYRQRRLEWRWRIDGLIAGADNGQRHKEDAPARLMLAFDGDKSKLPVKDLMFFEQVQLLAGQVMPYATLMYIWADHKPVGTVIRNPSTDRVRMIAAASGASKARTWKSFSRDIVNDFEAAFGEAPGRLIGIAIMTDSDNTRQKATAWYDDIHLRAHDDSFAAIEAR